MDNDNVPNLREQLAKEMSLSKTFEQESEAFLQAITDRNLTDEQLMHLMENFDPFDLPSEINDEINKEIQAPIVEGKVQGYVIARDGEVPRSEVKIEKEWVSYNRNQFKRGNAVAGYDKIAQGLNLTAMREEREKRTQELEDKRRINSEMATRAFEELYHHRNLFEGFKKFYKHIGLEKQPDGDVCLKIIGQENIDNLKLKDAKPGDVFGFELVNAVNSNGIAQLGFKLVKLHVPGMQ